MRAALSQHQPHPDWSLFIAGTLYLIARKLGCKLEPLDSRFLSDVLEIAVEQGKAAEEAEAELRRNRGY